PTGSEEWAGFANEDVSLYPLSFSDSGEITFTGATAGIDADVYFRFEYNTYPDIDPSFATTSVTVTGTAEASYSVDIPAQGVNTYSSFLLYVTTLDAPVTLTNVTVTSSAIADPCALVTCPTGQECVDGECVVVNGGPMVSAPTPPAREPADVISIYSDAYTDVVVDDFDFGLCGSSPAVAEEMIAGNPTQRYLGEGCQGINFENNRIDASAFTHLHFDFYTDEMNVIGKVFNLKLVDWAGNATEDGATGLEVNFNDGTNPAITTGSWVSVDVDITVLGPLVIGNLTTSDLAQIHLTSNLSNAWYDNLYLYKGESLPGTCNDGVMNQDETGIDCGGAICASCENEATILYVTTTVCDEASTVQMTGPWWGWDALAGPVALDNGDGSWTFTFDPAPTENMEYLLVLDGVQEDLIQAMVDGGSCAPLTDYWSYANRQWEVGSGDVSNVYGQCGNCVSTNDLSITLDVCGATPDTVRMTGPFWSWDPNAGPLASDNGDGTWTVSLPVPATDMEYLFVVDGVQENLIEDMVEGGSCAPITDYWSYANRIWLTADELSVNVNYDRCVSCSNPDVSITSEICSPEGVSEVKLVGPPNWDWNNGKSGVDNGDGTWTFSYTPIPTDSLEYQIFVDGVGENLVQEMIDGATCAPLSDYFSYANRLWVVNDGLAIENTYNTCLNCDGEAGISGLEFTFEVYPNPASDMISLSNVPSNYSYVIYNSLGSKLITGSNTGSVDVSSLMGGMYFIELIGKNHFDKVSFIKY
ncbi:MAG: T9SS type A sorting domain-containing protein, partial [Bacteroidetes bacterium]|nr:T9SS type A sorting domain-containing protein [Bacteroidota bacterium]